MLPIQEGYAQHCTRSINCAESMQPEPISPPKIYSIIYKIVGSAAHLSSSWNPLTKFLQHMSNFLSGFCALQPASETWLVDKQAVCWCVLSGPTCSKPAQRTSNCFPGFNHSGISRNQSCNLGRRLNQHKSWLHWKILSREYWLPNKSRARCAVSFQIRRNRE